MSIKVLNGLAFSVDCRWSSCFMVKKLLTMPVTGSCPTQPQSPATSPATGPLATYDRDGVIFASCLAFGGITKRTSVLTLGSN